MLFCGACENLLYAATDENKALLWICKACNRKETHDDVTTVYSALISAKASSDTQQLEVLKTFAQDPTVPVTTEKPCPKCGKSKVAWFVNPLEKPEEDMSLYFACLEPSCRHVWKAVKLSAGGK